MLRSTLVYLVLMAVWQVSCGVGEDGTSEAVLDRERSVAALEGLEAQEPVDWSLTAKGAKSKLLVGKGTLKDVADYLEAIGHLVGKPEVDQDWFCDTAAVKTLKGITAEQLQGWKKLCEASLSRNRPTMRWDDVRHTPSAVTNLRVLVEASSEKEALDAFLELHGSALRGIYAMTATDELAPVDAAPTIGSGSTGEPSAFWFRRLHSGLVVDGDSLGVILKRFPAVPGTWEIKFVGASWTRDLQGEPSAIGLSKDEAAAIVAGELKDAAHHVEATRYMYVGAPGHPKSLAVEVASEDIAGAPYRTYLNAVDGELLKSNAAVLKDHAGEILLMTGLPHEGQNKSVRPLPFAHIYDDVWEETIDGHSVETGDPAALQGETELDGTYVVPESQAPDPFWNVDLRGHFVRDQQSWDTLEQPLSLTLDLDVSAPLNLLPLFPFENESRRRRRLEAYYHMSYASYFLKEYAYGTQVFEEEPGNFPALMKVWLNQNNCSEWDPLMCCTGETTWNWIGGMNVGKIKSCWTDLWGPIAPASVERRCRGVLYHESGHLARFKTGVAPFFEDLSYMSYEEGRAEFSKAILGRFEDIRPEFRPEAKYPASWYESPSMLYYNAVIFANIFINYAHMLGPGPAAKVLNQFAYLATVDGETELVGDCADLGPNGNADGYETFEDCPGNSHYVKLVDAGFATWPAEVMPTYEASAVIHRQVVDPLPEVPGVQVYPWVDQVTNHPDLARFSAAAEYQPMDVFFEGHTVGSGPLRLDYPEDHDALKFFGRAGMRYRIQTWDETPPSDMDTQLQVYHESDSESVIAWNDDCGEEVVGGNVFACPQETCPGDEEDMTSCLEFEPQEDGYYMIVVSSFLLGATGATTQYSLAVEKLFDDFADSLSGATALAPGQSGLMGTMDGDGDEDWLKISSGAPQTAAFRVCSPPGPLAMPVTATVVTGSQQVLASWTWNDCQDPEQQLVIGTGNYYIRVESGVVPGEYIATVQLPEDLDLDSTPANALELKDFLPYRTYAFDFSEEDLEIEGGNFKGDWFKFDASEGDIFTIDVFAYMMTPAEAQVRLYAPEQGTFYSTHLASQLSGYTMGDTSGFGLGHWMLQSKSDGFSEGGAGFSFNTPVAGTYYLHVSPIYGGPRPYGLSFHRTYAQACCYPEFP